MPHRHGQWRGHRLDALRGEKRLHSELFSQGLELFDGAPGTLHHRTSGTGLVAYVRDLLMIAPSSVMQDFWEQLDKCVQPKGPVMPLQQYLGELHVMDEHRPDKPTAPRILTVSMVGYTRAAVLRTEMEISRVILVASTPYGSDKQWGGEGISEALFRKS